MPTRSAVQRRELERERYRASMEGCPSRQVLDALSDKWVTLVLSALAGGPQRYNGLARTIAGVSPKMLTQTLRALEREGLVSRTIIPSVPVRVDYELTSLGRSLLGLFDTIKNWADTHIEEWQTARAAYDEANPT